MRTAGSKVVTMRQAVAEHVRDSMSIAMGCALEGFIPFAAGHEILRQKRRNLTLIGPISDMLFDQMIGGGVVGRVIAAWVGNVSTGVGYNFRRAVEHGVPHPLTVEDHSNFTLALSLHAGAMGVPCGVTRSLFGSDIPKDQKRFREMSCPFSGERLLAVRAVNPDLAVIHAQKADVQGNVQAWGSFGVSLDAVRAAGKVIAVVEEIVSTEEVRADPNRTIIPGFLVDAVVREPWGAHPSAVQGRYGHDDDFYVEYSRMTRNPEEAARWFDRWVYGVASRSEYLELLDPGVRRRLLVGQPAPSPVVEFGY